MNEKMNSTEIVIPEIFQKCPPNRKKIERKKKYYLDNKEQDRPVIINSDKLMLDGYATYIALQELGVKEISFAVYDDDYFNKTIPLNSYKNNPTIYIYGIHQRKNGYHSKEFMWRVPNNKMDYVSQVLHIGDKALVNTKNGNRIVTITKIENHDICPVKDIRVRKFIKKISCQR